jgi:8-amino-7-oxononanoate synthase
VGSVSSLLAAGRKPTEDERIAIFSDASNHASIIDGIRHMERMKEGVGFVYKHRDMSHLESLLYVPFFALISSFSSDTSVKLFS